MNITKHPVPTKRATVILIKVKSCNALLRMLLVCIRGHLKSDLRYNFFNFVYVLTDASYIYVSKDVRIRG